MQPWLRIVSVLALLLTAACSRQPGLFNDTNATAHVSMLAGTIGSRPVGSAANARARDYIIDQLKQVGFEVRVQETDARRHELGRTARVANIIGILPGEKPDGIGLVSHYDSNPDAPGATDDALGVAVTLEATRVLAAQGRPQWTILALITDGEESGLMGAAGLVTDREVMNRLRVYLNLESIGSSGTSVLFETGPGNGWLVSPWARRAPHPRGGSYGIEVYRRLPNDTDFSILKTRDVPGLNFAAVGDSYAYHTARDTPERLSRETIRTTGENVVAVVSALQQRDITMRTADTATFFDIGGTTAIAYGPVTHVVLAALALITGVVAWVRVSSDALGSSGVLRWLLAIAWGWLGGLLVGMSMAAATWLLRLAREVYHPWYARPGRLFVLLLVTGLTVGWGMVRAGRWLPRRAHPARHPTLTWSVTLPVWILLAAAALWFAPSAAYLWVVPLAAAGVLLSVLPVHHDAVVRIASLIVLGITATLWLRETSELTRFVVAIMGRLPIITPWFVYAALLSAAGVMIVPPFIGLVATELPLRRPWHVTAIILAVLAIAIGAAYVAPAYTHDQPLRRYVRAIQETGAPSAIWEVASVEPGLDLTPDAPGEWMPTDGSAAAASIPW
ncbi:MAG TPA: M28 family peptidase, partial [Vicinamibacterales bacterium]|nr:M28 family peptidase [Vicinamibacterales bacterium]